MTVSGRALVLAVVVSGTLSVPAPLTGQDACPGASAVAAEAGWAAYQAGDMDEAGARFESALERCDDDHYARTGLGYVELRRGGEDRARSLFEAVVRAEPDNVDALVGLGLVHWREAELDDARARFGQVLDHEPDHPTALEYLDRLSVDRTGATDEADEAWDAGDTARARSLYAQRLREEPSDAVALLRLALMHGWDGELERGMELLDRLIDSDPAHLEARLVRARLLAWSGALDDARRAVLSVLEVVPDSEGARSTLALIQSWAGGTEEALESRDRLLGIAAGPFGARPDDARARAGGREPAWASYEALVAERPTDVGARVGLARARGLAGDFEGSIAEYRRALEIDPTDARAIVGLARVLGWSGSLVEAERTALDAIDTGADDASVWAVLAEIRGWQGRTGAAREALERALELAPNDPRARDQLRSLNLALAPRAGSTVRVEDDSDGNRMVTTTLTASSHPLPRLQVDAEAYYRDLGQVLSFGPLERSARGLSVDATYELDPGWNVSAGIAGSATSGLGDPSFLGYRLSVRTPGRHRVDGSVELTSFGLDETAAMVERGVHATLLFLSGRWRPATDWRIDGQVGLGSYEATQSNGRRSALLTVTRSLGGRLFLGAGVRALSFEKDLLDGYFDPDFYGIAEVSGSWVHRPLPWTFQVEVAPGLEQVTTDGDATAALRGSADAGYRIAGSGEVTLGFSYSTASVTAFGEGGRGYEYVAARLGIRWIFG